MNDDEESDEEYICPYIASDFAVTDVYKGEGFTITQVLMPDASISPLCRCIYFAYSSDWKERFVYTVERSPEDTYLLCGVSAQYSGVYDASHRNEIMGQTRVS